MQYIMNGSLYLYLYFESPLLKIKTKGSNYHNNKNDIENIKLNFPFILLITVWKIF
jgi:hypothetical protein